MNQEFLCKFAGPDHPKMCGAFSFGDYSYATNGHIMVRVPRLDDVPEWDALNEQAAALFENVDYNVAENALVGIPAFQQPAPVACKICNGSGKISVCPECDGEGEVTLENDYHEYECECLTCFGEGKVHGNDAICHACDGTGNIPVVKKIEVGCALFSSRYLNMLKELPGVKLAPTNPDGANYFKWDGGDGLLMPMRG